MLTVGRYRIAFGWACWFQSHGPVTARRILWFFWIIREVRPEDIDKKQQFPLGTRMMADGTEYRYYKAGKDIHVSDDLTRMQANTAQVCEKLGISPDDYMMFYCDFPYEKMMAINHLGKHSIAGDIYDVVTKDGCVVSFRIRRCRDHVNTS